MPRCVRNFRFEKCPEQQSARGVHRARPRRARECLSHEFIPHFDLLRADSGRHPASASARLRLMALHNSWRASRMPRSWARTACKILWRPHRLYSMYGSRSAARAPGTWYRSWRLPCRRGPRLPVPRGPGRRPWRHLAPKAEQPPSLLCREDRGSVHLLEVPTRVTYQEASR